ncbi:MAG: response regulator [SAR202 cluster bacterium]|nr:response regulator [SAR202 cluster bacterium]MDP7103025.1 response regulator [SAR202 cluster bacterium]
MTRSDGHIAVDSVPGSGAKFSVHLRQVLDGPRRESAKNSPDTVTRGSEVLLLAEHDDSVRTVVGQMVQAQDYSVVEAANRAGALEAVVSADSLIDLLLTDLDMPGMSGPQLAEEVLKLRPEVRVIFLSGHAGGAAVAGGNSNANADFIAKPVTPDQLSKNVGEILRRRLA